ncbi:MAG: glycosyltransferase family 4 protein [Hungatella sp.]|nr:glycosyltransferase family 4 protein [Hungatella sp.]
MKVIVANYRFFVAGGPERYMFNFMAAAHKRGIQVIPFSVRNPENEWSEYESYFAKPRADALMYADTKHSLKNMYGIFRAVVWNFDAQKRLKALIRETKPDAIYILHEINHLSPSIIRTAKKEGIRVIHRISDFFMFCARYDFLCGDEICQACHKGQYGKAIRKRCVKGSRAATILRVFAMKLYQWNKVFDDVDLFITPSAFTREKLIEGGVADDRIVHIPTFIDSQKVTPCYSHEPYFLFSGRVAKQKGTIYAIQAMNRLKNSGYVLKITGTLSGTKEDEALRQYINDNHLEDKIVFTGFLKGKELEELIAHAACIVCPAIWYENMPNTVLEAYAYGKPVVASRLGSLTEIVEDKKTGFLFEPKNSHELSEILKRFMDDETLSEQMGREARKKCEREFGEDMHMKRVISCLKGA